MSDHAFNVAVLAIIAVVSGSAELAIFRMILQDYRKDRGKKEITVPTKRWLGMGALSLGPLVALLVGYLFVSGLRSPSPGSTLAPATVGVPLVKALGGSNETCGETIDGSQLMKWSDKYNVALICAIIDSTVDILEDERVTVSDAFAIHPGDIEIEVPYSKPMLAFQESILSDVRKTLPKSSLKGTPFAVPIMVWSETVLLPKSSRGNDIRKLSDVARHGGVVISQ